MFEQMRRRAAGAEPPAEPAVQRKPTGPVRRPAAETPAPGHKDTGGAPLEPSVRQHFESRLGADLDGVRIHTGAPVEQSAADLGALAFTVGQHVHFGAGQYQPQTAAGERLLAHELAHTLQQRESGAAGGAVSRPGDHAEVEADAVADQVGRGGPAKAPRVTSSAPQVSLATDPSVQAIADLERAISESDWKWIRPRVYAKEAAPGIQAAKDRKAGKPDLTGLGSIKTLDHFAAAMKRIQHAWPKTPDARVAAVRDAVNAELVGAGVPPFLDVRQAKMEPRGLFLPGTWAFLIQAELVSKDVLTDDDAAELANTALHEARHAEQHFVAARCAAAPPHNEDATTIAHTSHIPDDIAKKAVAKKLDASTDPAVAAFGRTMYAAHVTHAVANQKVSDDFDATLKALSIKRNEAQTVLANLRANRNDGNIAAARKKRAELAALVAEVERRYPLYRNIPQERDAHEVGDAEELAFKGWT